MGERTSDGCVPIFVTGALGSGNPKKRRKRDVFGAPTKLRYGTSQKLMDCWYFMNFPYFSGIANRNKSLMGTNDPFGLFYHRRV